jgi:hypothetical protein
MTTVDISLDVPRLEVASTKGEDDGLFVLVLPTGTPERYGLSYVEYSANSSEASIRAAECDKPIERREPDWSGGSIAKYTWLRPNEGWPASSPLCSDPEVALVGLGTCARSPGRVATPCATYIDVGYWYCAATAA